MNVDSRSALVAVATSCVSVVFYHECHQETVRLEIRISTFTEEVEIKFRGKIHDKTSVALIFSGIMRFVVRPVHFISTLTDW